MPDDRRCSCWYVFDRNEGRTGTVRECPRLDCPDCHGKGYLADVGAVETGVPDDKVLTPEGVTETINYCREHIARRGGVHFCEDFGCSSVLPLALSHEALRAQLAEATQQAQALREAYNFTVQGWHERFHRAWASDYRVCPFTDCKENTARLEALAAMPAAAPEVKDA